MLGFDDAAGNKSHNDKDDGFGGDNKNQIVLIAKIPSHLYR